ncbi:MAG: tetratricopeptide repeat protein [Magnetococcales bacterium]|nr:tetratricopeptide repeat protein [Magnetococcales bacterium]
MNRAEKRAQQKQAKQTPKNTMAQPNQERAQKILQQGVQHHQAQRLDESVACYREALALQPDLVTAWCNLSFILRSQGQLQEAAAGYKKALSLKSDLPGVHYNLGNIFQDLEQWSEAATCFKNTIFLKPDHAKAHYNLGNVYHKQKMLDEAVNCYNRAIDLNPDYALALCNLGVVFGEQDKFDLAIACHKKALTLMPDHVEAHFNLGRSLKEQGRLEEAIACQKQAIALSPNHAQAHCNMAAALKEKGELDEAIASFDNALLHHPDFAEAHYSRALAKKFSEPSELQPMIDLLEKQQTLEEEEREKDSCLLHFALGKAYADLKQNTEAFSHFLKGNQLNRKTFQHDIADDKRDFERIRRVFDASFFEQRSGYGLEDETPIFILGMPRSGSTLIEQILSSHPDVYGAGELNFIRQSVQDRVGSHMLSFMPKKIARLQPEAFQEMGREYIAKLREISPKSRFITDKMPHNFLNVGIIRLMLPKAKIIHSVRSPEDTCLSIFRLKFLGVHNYAYDLTELGQYYRLYAEMMAHWHRVLPGVIYDVNYEQLTANQEEETRKLLQFCQLEWDDNCLNFHQTVRAVKTASNVQVRQPMYRSSVAGWRKFEKELQPLIEALGDLSSDHISQNS